MANFISEEKLFKAVDCLTEQRMSIRETCKVCKLARETVHRIQKNVLKDSDLTDGKWLYRKGKRPKFVAN